MNPFLKITTTILLLLFFVNCQSKKESKISNEDARVQLEMVTNYGTILLELYNETPLHRDNFIKLVGENAFDSLLFHRVINKFMIQGGDPDSRSAKPNDTLGEGDLPYTIYPELNPNHFHKKGALGAAREDVPSRASSAMQFYIVQGKAFNDSLLNLAESRINENLSRHYFRNDSISKNLYTALTIAKEKNDTIQYKFYNDSIKNEIKNYNKFDRYVIPESHREVYKTIGGTPHLDQSYTVFGQVLKRLEVIDSIANVKTDAFDRPINNVRIRSVRILDNN